MPWEPCLLPHAAALFLQREAIRDEDETFKTFLLTAGEAGRADRRQEGRYCV